MLYPWFTVGLVTKKEKNLCVSLSFYLSANGMWPPSLECPINGCPKPHSSNHPWPLDGSALDTLTELLPWFYCPQHNPSLYIIISRNYDRCTKVRNEKQSHQVVKRLQPGTFMISAPAYHWGVSKQCWHCLWHAALEQYDTFTDISFNLSPSANLASCAAR